MSEKPTIFVNADLLKSQVKAFTRKDGAFVQAHSDKRVAAAPANYSVSHNVSSGSEGDVHEVKGKPADIEKHLKMRPGSLGPQDGDHYSATHQIAHADGTKHSIYADGDSVRIRPVGHKDAAATAALKQHIEGGGKSAAPAIGTHAKALRESSKPDDMDHWHNQIAADQMAAGDHKALSGTLKGMDTAARDHVLEHIHPDHHEGLGFKTLNHERSVAGYDKKFPAAKPAAPKKRASPKKAVPAPIEKPAAAAPASMSHDDWESKVKEKHPGAVFKKNSSQGQVHAYSGTNHVGMHTFAQGGKPSSSHIDEPKQAAAPETKSNNETWGFHGEASSQHMRDKHGPDDYYRKATEQDHIDAKASADKKFSAAAHHLVQAGHFDKHEHARDYLDSKSGRHLHDAAPDGDISKVKWLGSDAKTFKAQNADKYSLKKSMLVVSPDLLK